MDGGAMNSSNITQILCVCLHTGGGGSGGIGGTIVKRDYIVHARIFKAMSDENRLRILDLLREKERNASELLELMDFGQSTLSHHMKILINAGVVVAKRQGKWVIYHLDGSAVRKVYGFMEHYFNEQTADL